MICFERLVWFVGVESGTSWAAVQDDRNFGLVELELNLDFSCQEKSSVSFLVAGAVDFAMLSYIMGLMMQCHCHLISDGCCKVCHISHLTGLSNRFQKSWVSLNLKREVH